MLREATDEIWGFAGHSVATARDGRLATSILRSVTSSSVVTSGQDYELPPMAVGDTVDSVIWVSSDSQSEWPLTQIPLGLEQQYTTPASTGVPTNFAFLDGVVRIYPRPNLTGSLRITYQRRHGELVVGSDTASVTAVTDNGGFARVTLTATPSSFVAGAWLDFMGVTYPYRIKLHGASITTAHGSNQFTLSATYAAFVAASLVGDTATLYGKTPYVHLPMELRSALTARIAGKISGQLGDIQREARLEGVAERDGARAMAVMSPRGKASPQKAFNPNSLLRRRIRGWFS